MVHWDQAQVLEKAFRGRAAEDMHIQEEGEDKSPSVEEAGPFAPDEVES
jgi:hypothetical protein